MMHFSPVSDFPPIFEKKLDFLENFTNFPFSRKKFPFSSDKISDDLVFLVIDHKFRISPYFALFYNIFPPSFSTIYNFPLFPKFSPSVSKKFSSFLHTLRVFPPLL